MASAPIFVYARLQRPFTVAHARIRKIAKRLQKNSSLEFEESSVCFFVVVW